MEFQPDFGSPQSLNRSLCFKCKKNFDQQNEAFAISESGEHLCNDCCCGMRKSAHIEDDIFSFGGMEFQPLAGLGSQPHAARGGQQGRPAMPISGAQRNNLQQQDAQPHSAPAASAGHFQASPQMMEQGGSSPQTMARSSCFKCKKGFTEENEAFAICESGEHLCNDCCCEMRKLGRMDDDIFKIGGLEFEALGGLGSQPHCARGGRGQSMPVGQSKAGSEGMQSAARPQQQQFAASNMRSADQQGMDQNMMNRRM